MSITALYGMPRPGIGYVRVGTDAPPYSTRTCRQCGKVGPWGLEYAPDGGLATACGACGAPYGRVTFGLDRLADHEAALLMERERIAAGNRAYAAQLRAARRELERTRGERVTFRAKKLARSA